MLFAFRALRMSDTHRLPDWPATQNCTNVLVATQNTKTMPNYLTTMHKNYDHDTG